MAKIKEVTINDFLLNGMRNGLDDWFCHFTAYTQSMLPIININMNNVRFTNQQAYQHWTASKLIALPYIPRKITCTQIYNGQSVISDSFSGCYMAKIRRGQDEFVCHVSKDDSYDKSLEYLEQNETVLQLFKPTYFFCSDNELRLRYLKIAAELHYNVNLLQNVYGLITSDGDCYAFVLGRYNIVTQSYPTGRNYILSMAKLENTPGGLRTKFVYSRSHSLHQILWPNVPNSLF